MARAWKARGSQIPRRFESCLLRQITLLLFITAMNSKFKILLYYKYIPLKDPELIKNQQKELCERLGLKGRILISSEGINGTCAGQEKEINEYIKETQKIPEFVDIEWEVSWAEIQVFPRLGVVVRDEIVTLGIKKTGMDVSLKNKADYIQPEELKELYEKNEDFIILDARNAYEAHIGKFKNALVPPIDSFRDFPEFVEKKLADYKDKNVVTYCTGGVRCEKASAFLREKGFKHVRQLHGGVHRYAEETGGKYFEGELFVFDKRLHVPINTVDPTVLTTCKFCQKPVTRYLDCVVPMCDEFLICCEECEKINIMACSVECQQRWQDTVVENHQKSQSI
jgi:UPF0176 protein